MEAKEENVTITLSHPVTIAGKTYSTVQLRPPTAGDLEDLPLEGKSYKMSHMLGIAQKISDADTPLLIKKMRWTDAQKVIAAVNTFLSDGQEIGESA